MYTIPVEGYETQLQDLGEHVDHHETPIKVIKITKTIAVKVPVPYPVKIVQKVPYPVHIVKPYPVPVPHIVKVPQAVHKHAHDAGLEGLQQDGGHQPYQVQETPHNSGNGHSFVPIQEESYNGGGYGQNVESYAEEYPSDEGSVGGSYDVPAYHGSSGSPHGADAESFETKSYNQAIQAYLHKNQPNGAHSFHGYQ